MKKIGWIVTALVLLASLVWAFLPKPVDVDFAEVTRGPLQVTVDNEGKTRVKERFVVSSPAAGRMLRIDLKEGDAVVKGQTVLARIDPALPSLLDQRSVAGAQAAVEAAEANVQQAQASIERATAELGKSQVDLRRSENLLSRNAVSPDEVDTNRLTVAVRQAELRSAQFALTAAQAAAQQARAVLLQVSGPTTRSVEAIEIKSPVDGRVLKLLQESEAVVAAGAALVEVGDVGQLEAVVDVLSRDAVKIRRGAAVMLERWGGGDAIAGVVRQVEPSAFTKVSALGVEEQRVNVIVDLAVSPDTQRTLGDGYRVDARIVTWQRDEVTAVPTGALFREGTQWAVFADEQGIARTRRLKLGAMNDQHAEVLEGISAGQRVVLHPSDKIRDGVRIQQRSSDSGTEAF